MKLSYLSAISVLLVGQAFAATTTVYSTTQKVGSTSLTFNVDQFDSSLGTLTGVNVFVTSSLLGSADVTNSAPDGTTTVSGFESTFYAGSDDANLGYGSVKSSYLDNVVTTPDWHTAVMATGVLQTFTLGAGQNFSIAPVNVDSGNFSYYIGSGTVSFKARDTTLVSLNGSQIILNTVDSGANTQFGVTYTYDEVSAIPEPSSVLFSGGLLCSALFIRRRRI